MAFSSTDAPQRLNIAVIGSGIAGMSAAWLLSQRHAVTVYEKEARLGGHANTVQVDGQGVDTGFIVYNEATYPNLTALFAHLNVATQGSDMSFGVSLDGGRLEYSSVGAGAFLCGGRNLLSPRFLAMAGDLVRFYREAPGDVAAAAETLSLGDYLRLRGYGAAFQRDHILPQAAAIWSASTAAIRDYPARAFVRFFENHGLLKFKGRPAWRTVTGGSAAYVRALTAAYADRVRLSCGAVGVRRDGAGVWVRDERGETQRYDDVVIAAHADEALALLDDAGAEERAILSTFAYSANRAVLHTDAGLMPKRRALWASWNYLGDDASGCYVSYWMNRLQRLEGRDLFLTLNPPAPPRAGTVLRETTYGHPIFNAAALGAQARLWSLQGVRRTWFCGAYFGAGFHEDGLQAGLAVAEALGGVRRPWQVADESGRIQITPRAASRAAA